MQDKKGIDIKKMGGFFSSPVFIPKINPNDLRSNRNNIIDALDLSEKKDTLLREYARTGKYPENVFRFSPPFFTKSSLQNFNFVLEDDGKKLYSATVKKLTIRVYDKKIVLRDFKVKIIDTFFFVDPSLFSSQM